MTIHYFVYSSEFSYHMYKDELQFDRDNCMQQYQHGLPHEMKCRKGLRMLLLLNAIILINEL